MLCRFVWISLIDWYFVKYLMVSEEKGYIDRYVCKRMLVQMMMQILQICQLRCYSELDRNMSTKQRYFINVEGRGGA